MHSHVNMPPPPPPQARVIIAVPHGQFLGRAYDWQSLHASHKLSSLLETMTHNIEVIVINGDIHHEHCNLLHHGQCISSPSFRTQLRNLLSTTTTTATTTHTQGGLGGRFRPPSYVLDIHSYPPTTTWGQASGDATRDAVIVYTSHDRQLAARRLAMAIRERGAHALAVENRFCSYSVTRACRAHVPSALLELSQTSILLDEVMQAIARHIVNVVKCERARASIL